jgi:hypothetical protein
MEGPVRAGEYRINPLESPATNEWMRTSALVPEGILRLGLRYSVGPWLPSRFQITLSSLGHLMQVASYVSKKSRLWRWVS